MFVFLVFQTTDKGRDRLFPQSLLYLARCESLYIIKGHYFYKVYGGGGGSVPIIIIHMLALCYLLNYSDCE